MPHEGLRVFHIGAKYLQPCSVRASEHLPVHPTNAQLSRGWFNVTNEYVVIPDGSSFYRRLKYTIIHSVCLYSRIVASATSSLEFDGHGPQSVDALDYGFVHRDR